MSKNQWKEKGIMTLLSLMIFSLFFAGIITSALAGSPNYTLDLARGTTMFEVNEYDEDAWNDSVGDNVDPDDWFKGDGEEVSARSKVTVRSVSKSDWDMYDILTELFDVLDEFSDEEVKVFMGITNFTEENITGEYSNEFTIWMVIMAKWEFTKEDFEEEPDKEYLYNPVLVDPEDLIYILDDYNDWAAKVNPVVMMMGLDPFPIISGDDFLWYLLMRGYPVPNPIENYLEKVIDTLEVNDTTVKSDTIIMEKVGEDDYTIEIKYGSNGMQSIIEIKDSEGEIIYQITSINAAIDPVLILLIILVSLSAVIFGIAIWKRKSKPRVIS